MNLALPRKNFVLFFLMAFLLAAPAFAQWTPKAAALRKRSETTSVVYGGKIYTFLGFKDDELNVENTSEVYDPATDTWKLLAPLPEEKVVTHQGVVLVDDKVWHIGGRVGKSPGRVTSETWIYDITNNTWTPGPQIVDPATNKPLRWGGGGAALLGRTLHLFGGFVNTGCDGDQSTYHLTLDVDSWIKNPVDPALWKNESALLPIARNHIGTAVLGGKIYAIGGQFGHDCGGGLDTTYSHVYDPVANAWSELPALPDPRSHVEGSIFTMDGKIYLFAGQTEKSINTNRVTIFDPAANNGAGEWYDDPSLALPTRFEGLSAKAIDNNIYISHGGEGSSYQPRNATYVKTITRTPVYQLGFPAQCGNFLTALNSVTPASTLLFTIDGTKDYTSASSASWLKIVKNASGNASASGTTIGLSVNTAGLDPGNYSATITATPTGGGPAYTAATYCVNVTVQQMPELTVAAETIFSGVKGRTTPVKYLALSNTGSAPLHISALDITGANAESFALVNPPALPLSIGAGESLNLGVQFAPSILSIGSLSAALNIGSDDLDEPTAVVGLYGLSTLGEQGNFEPPLDAVVKTLGYNINVGGTTLVIGTGPEPIGDELLLPLFKKAGAGPVTMKPVARYSPDDLLSYGYYTKPNGEPVVAEIGKIALNQEQTLLPAITSGSVTSFEPGDDIFGFFTGATKYAGQNTYTEDHFNTGPLPHSARVYPLKDRSGKAIPNSYLVAFEPASNGDYQDYVFEVTNVVPAENVRTLEAEKAVLSGAFASSNRAGYSGTGFADFVNESGDYVEWTVNKADAGPALLTFRYANSGGDKPLKLEVNGVVVKASQSFEQTGGNWSVWGSVADTVNLRAGENKIRLTSIGSSGPNIDYLFVRELTIPIARSPDVLEAEDATLNGPRVDAYHKGYTGRGFADFLNRSGDYIEWDLSKPTAGMATLSIRYANGSKATRSVQLTINGVVISSSLAFPASGNWVQWNVLKVSAELLAGNNKIRITAIGSSGPNIDHLAWEENNDSGLAEGELAKLSGAGQLADMPGYTGTGFADIRNSINDYVEWTISKTTAGPALLNFRYGNGSPRNRPLRLEVNGVVIDESLDFPSLGVWYAWDTVAVSVALRTGENKVKLTSIGYNGPNLDHLYWYGTGNTSNERVASVQSSAEQRAMPLPTVAPQIKGFNVSVSPNPAKNIASLYVASASALPFDVTITDMAGKIYKRQSYKNEGTNYVSLPVQDLAPGMYLIFVRQGSERSSVKLLLQ